MNSNDISWNETIKKEARESSECFYVTKFYNVSMSVQEEEKEITGIKQKEREKTNSSSIEFNIDDYKDKVIASSNFSQRKNKITSRNFENLIDYRQTIKTMKEIKCNFMEEHKNIINTYYSIYSKQLDDIIYYNLNENESESYNKCYKTKECELLTEMQHLQ